MENPAMHSFPPKLVAWAALSILALITPATLPAQEAPGPLTLWYQQPARQWTEAMPIGNGRLGAMIFGGADREHLQLNEDTLWAGGPYNPNNPDAFAALAAVRQLVFAGQYDDADKLISQKMMARPLRQMPYETAGDLFLDFATNQPVTDYRRELNLDTAVARVAYTRGGVKFTREMYSSPVDQVIVVRLTADQPGQISFIASLQAPQKNSVRVDINDATAAAGTAQSATLIMDGVNRQANGIPGALKFSELVRVLPDHGKIMADSDQIYVTDADSATLLIAISTSFKNYHDVTGDPFKITKRQLNNATLKHGPDKPTPLKKSSPTILPNISGSFAAWL